MVKVLILSFFFVCLPLRAADQPLAGIDTFGSHQITIEQILKGARTDIEQFSAAIAARDMKTAEQAHNSAKEKIEKLAKFAFFKLSLIQYPPPNSNTYVTVDLVDPADRDRRMNFKEPPHKKFSDPNNLLASWDSYQALALDLIMSGQLKGDSKCPVFHCIGGFDDPRLKKYGDLFNREVPKHEGILIQILHNDENAQHRATAAFLLAHIHDGKKLVRELAENVRDPGENVRNNVMRVFGYIGEFHPELELPTEEIAEALNFPTATDRNKALFTLASISKRESQRTYLTKTCGQTLVAILRLQQPNNHDPAYTILKNLSGKTFGDRDYVSWERWLTEQGYASNDFLHNPTRVSDGL